MIAVTSVVLDARSTSLRLKENALGNYVADIVKVEYSADISIINAGSIRSDQVFEPGPLTVGNIIDLFPFRDIVVMIEVTGKQIYDAIENGVSQVL